LRVLITGGLGQIGSHVAEQLLASGNEVIIIDDLSTGRIEHLNVNEKLTIILGSIADRKLVETVFTKYKPDAILHAAASFKNPNDWYNDTMTNCVGAINIIQSAENSGTKRFVYLQTSLCYGQKPESNPITLDHKIAPSGSSYAISKTVNEQYLALSSLDFVSFRLANIIGPRNIAGPLPIFYNRLKEGLPCTITDTKRDFIDVRDLSNILCLAINGTGTGYYNFSSGKSIAIKKLYDLISVAMGASSNAIYSLVKMMGDDVHDISLDNSRTIQDFGNIEFTDLTKTVRDAIDYYEEFGIAGEYTHLKIT
jgi:UDP-glucose 4-epimerase